MPEPPVPPVDPAAPAPSPMPVEQMLDVLAAARRPGTPASPDDRRWAEATLELLGIPGLLRSLELAERVLRFGDGFHPVARFFVDGSDEQAYVRGLMGRPPPS